MKFIEISKLMGKKIITIILVERQKTLIPVLKLTDYSNQEAET